MKDERDSGIWTESEELSGPEKDTAFAKCENCGGNMRFDPQTQSLKCDHCGTEDDFAKNRNVQENAIEEAFQQSVKWNEETTVYRCENCGAQFEMKADEVAVKCPYCSTTHIIKSEDLAGIKPTAVYPFILSEDEAVAASRKWARRRIFSPRSFKKELKEKNLSGTYMPCFTFDSDTSSVYEGVIGQRKTRTVRRNGKTYTQTYTEWHHVSGRYNKFFDDIAIACGDMDQAQMQKLMPFKGETLCVYEQKFLSGYTASHYKRNVSECWGDAKSMMDATIRTGILHSYGCDVVKYLNVSTAHSAVTYKYVLLPLYMLNYKFGKKQYPVVINGNTGKVHGKAPVSPLRVAIAVLLGLAALIGLGYLIIYDGDASVQRDGYTLLQESVGSSNACLSDCLQEYGYVLKK